MPFFPVSLVTPAPRCTCAKRASFSFRAPFAPVRPLLAVHFGQTFRRNFLFVVSDAGSMVAAVACVTTAAADVEASSSTLRRWLVFVAKFGSILIVVIVTRPTWERICLHLASCRRVMGLLLLLLLLLRKQ